MAEGSGDFSLGGAVWPGLSKLVEECGEVQQVAGKLIGSRGNPDHWDGSDLRGRIAEELADLEAAIIFFVTINGLNSDQYVRRRDKKASLFAHWHVGASS